MDIRWPADGGEDQPAAGARQWVGVLFECCGLYSRVYRNVDVKQYNGTCPSCGRRVRIKVGEGGIAARLLRATPIS